MFSFILLDTQSHVLDALYDTFHNGMRFSSYIGAGCGFERTYGETFHRNCYYRGRGDRVSFLPISSLRLSNELHSPSSHHLGLKNHFPSLHEGHIGEEAGLLLLKGSFSQFCGVTDEE